MGFRAVSSNEGKITKRVINDKHNFYLTLIRGNCRCSGGRDPKYFAAGRPLKLSFFTPSPSCVHPTFWRLVLPLCVLVLKSMEHLANEAELDLDENAAKFIH